MAARALADGHLAVIPTETVYGLGARADLPDAIARVYTVKQRPADHPLIVHVRSESAAWQWASTVPDYARALAEQAWPGPLTLVLNRSARAGDVLTGGQDCVAVRVPHHPLTQAVLQALAARCSDDAVGVAAPSANRFGRVSPTTAEHVLDELGALLEPGDVILDGGPCIVGVESTIIDATGPAPRLLRPGALTAEQVTAITGLPVITGSTVRAPGTLAAHYAPTAQVLVVHDPAELTKLAALTALTEPSPPQTTGLIALASVTTPEHWIRVSAPSDATEYARSLYAALRAADARGLTRIVAVVPHDTGLWAAIVDRLTRAATREPTPPSPAP